MTVGKGVIIRIIILSTKVSIKVEQNKGTPKSVPCDEQMFLSVATGSRMESSPSSIAIHVASKCQ